jgi:hypothetical protein
MSQTQYSTMVDKGTLVADIVKTREPLVKKIEEQRINLLKLGQVLRALADVQKQVTQSSDTHLAEQITGLLLYGTRIPGRSAGSLLPEITVRACT